MVTRKQRDALFSFPNRPVIVEYLILEKDSTSATRRPCGQLMRSRSGRGSERLCEITFVLVYLGPLMRFVES